MVLFTITPSIVEGLKARNEMPPSAETSDEKSSFEDAAVGSPISHEQIVDLWKHLKAKRDGNCHLEDLLRGSRVYVPPPAPKPEPVCLPPIQASGGSLFANPHCSQTSTKPLWPDFDSKKKNAHMNA